jgi:hypothetical protein
MARTVLPVTDVPSSYAIDGTAVTWTAWDSGQGNRFLCTGREILLARNTNGASAETVTVTSQADDKGRTGDIDADSIPANGMHVYQKFPLAGWADSSNYVNVDGSTTDVEFAVLRLPS